MQSNKVKLSRGKDEYKNFDKHDEKEINNENRLKGPNKGELSFVSRGTLRTKVMIYGAVGAVPAKHRLKLKVYVSVSPKALRFPHKLSTSIGSTYRVC